LFAVILLAGCSHNVQEVVDDLIPNDDVIVEDVVDDGEVEEAVDVREEIKDRNNPGEEAEEGEDAGDEVVTDTYIIDAEASTINWKADRVLSAGHYGTVTIKEGTATYENSRLTSATATIDMTTITSDGGDGLNGHLANEDFFDVANHPEATIVITFVDVVEDPDGDTITATADLTIKGITNEITFPITEDEYWTIANITIDRTLWDIRYGSTKFFDDLADKAIKDEIEFEVNIAYE
jgi:polyisoprenoid-binding protein YceI